MKYAAEPDAMKSPEASSAIARTRKPRWAAAFISPGCTFEAAAAAYPGTSAEAASCAAGIASVIGMVSPRAVMPGYQPSAPPVLDVFA